VSELYGLRSTVGYKFHVLNHFLNRERLPQGLAFALHFPVPRKCLQCGWHEPSLLAMVTLLAAAFSFNPAARAQDAPTAPGVQGQVQSVGNNPTQESNSMEAIGLLVTLEARPGKEADAEAFLKSAQPLALKENGTLKWYAIKLGPGKFGIFDTFANEAGRNAHLGGEIAKALGARANELFATPPQIEKVEILATTPLKNQV
jgi:quinol monooxygenase YgiN